MLEKVNDSNSRAVIFANVISKAGLRHPNRKKRGIPVL